MLQLFLMMLKINKNRGASSAFCYQTEPIFIDHKHLFINVGKVSSFSKPSDFTLESSHLLHNYLDKYISHYIIDFKHKKCAVQ